MTFRSCFSVGWLLLFAGGLGPGCGRISAGGETGSETHWLASCESTADCRVGQCLCGICTEPCGVALDCPAPLDVCTEPLDAQAASCQTAICTSSAPGETEAALEGVQRVDACHAGRPTSLVLVPGRAGALQPFGNGDQGFLIADFMSQVRRVSRDGRPGAAQSEPSELLPQISELAPSPDGSTLLAGSVEDFDGRHAWVAKVDANWSLSWERQLAPTSASAVDVAVLPDGGAVVLSFRQEEQPDVTEKSSEAIWTRVSPTGEVIWQQQEAFQAPANELGWGATALALTDALELRILVTTKDGSRVIFGSLDGEKDARALDVSMETFTHILALPGGGFALVSNDSHMVATDAAGSAVWARAHATGTGDLEHVLVYGAAFDEARQELVLVGANAWDGSWMQALDLEGHPTWELSLLPQVSLADGRTVLRSGQGPRLNAVAVGPEGSLLATGIPGDLEYLWVGGGSCD